MANNEKLNQIVSNLQILSDLTKSMMNAEIYPVSFFSQAFDYLQKLQSDFHTLEAEQVEMFATQMEKHRKLIMSIHQQMQTMSVSEPASTPKVSEPAPQPANIEPAPQPVKIEPAPQPKAVTEKITIRTETPPPLPAETVAKEEFVVSEPEPLPSETVPKKIITTNESIEKNVLSDLRKAITLNDRFRFRRELFGGNDETMNRAIAALNSKQTLAESLAFLEQKLHWDLSRPVVKDFIKTLEIRFL